MEAKGKNWKTFEDAYESLKSSSFMDQQRLRDLDLCFAGGGKGYLFHNGIGDLKKISIDESITGDALRVGTNVFQMSTKAMMDIVNILGLKGELLSESCPERAAFMSKLMQYSNEEYRIFIRGNTVINIRKNINNCPNIVETVNILPNKTAKGKGNKGKDPKAWVITDDFLKVAIEYKCLGSEKDCIPYAIVLDSESGESALQVAFGVKVLTEAGGEGFFKITDKSYRHDNRSVTKVVIYQDALEMMDEVSLMKEKLLNCKKKAPVEQFMFNSSFEKLLNKGFAASVNEAIKGGKTLYDQICTFICMACEAAKDWNIRRKNSLIDKLSEEVFEMIV